MTDSKKVKDKNKKSEEKQKESLVKEAKETKKESVTKKPKNLPKLVLKEKLTYKGKKCTFVEKLKGKVIVRFDEGGYSLVEEKDLESI